MCVDVIVRIRRGMLRHLAVDMLSQQLVAIKKQALPNEAAERELLMHCTLQRYPHANVLSMIDYFVADDGK